MLWGETGFGRRKEEQWVETLWVKGARSEDPWELNSLSGIFGEKEVLRFLSCLPWVHGCAMPISLFVMLPVHWYRLLCILMLFGNVDSF